MTGRDITGEKCGLLTAKKMLEERTKDGKILYLCECDCGNERVVTATKFRNGKVFSCGCTHKNKKYYGFSLNDEDDRRLYRIWNDMKRRCEDPRRDDYKNYGGRGIRVCVEWVSFKNFLEWARKAGYDSSLSLDRINTNGNYEPSNCRWATAIQQANNKRSNHMITFNGTTLSMAEWSRKVGMSYSSIRSRLRSGWSVEKTLTTPIKGVNV